MFENNVWERREVRGQQLSANVYNAIIGGVFSYGFIANYLMVKYIPTESILSINPIIFFIGYFVSCLIGILMFTKSESAFISFIGYNFVVIPFGLIINLVVSRYDPDIVLNAMAITGIVTIIMMVAGMLFPKVFERMVGIITIVLFAVILGELALIFIFGARLEILDWVVAACFCCYIGFDWGRAQRIPKTMDNAVDSAAALYMDIINLFLRILRILGRRR